MARKKEAQAPIHVLVRLRPDLHRRAKIRAVKEGRPLSELFRDALARYLEEARSA